MWSPDSPAAIGQALLACVARSHGGYVLLRTGERWRRVAGQRVEELRVNVRRSAWEEVTTTSSGSLLQALERAAARLTQDPGGH